jgi:ribosomal-protein-alanine N-acetyltransferase
MTQPALPTIETARLLLRGAAPGDVDVWAACLEDPGVLRYLPKRTMTIRERAERMLSYEQLWDQEPIGGLGRVITRKADGQLMGWCGARYHAHAGDAELSYALGVPYWGQGYATEAAQGLVRFIFENTPWNHLFACTLPGNDASQRVLTHLGFTYERDINYQELAGDKTIQMDEPMSHYFLLQREQFAPGDSLYRTLIPSS